MLNSACVNCKLEMTVEKNDVPLVHFINNKEELGIDVVRFGDIWCCTKCDTRVMLGMGKQILGQDLTNCEDFLKAHPNFVEAKR